MLVARWVCGKGREGRGGGKLTAIFRVFAAMVLALGEISKRDARLDSDVDKLTS